MKEIFNSNCPVMLSKVQWVLEENAITSRRVGEHTSNLFAGAVDMLAVRILVGNERYWDAARILRMERITPSCDLKR